MTTSEVNKDQLEGWQVVVLCIIILVFVSVGGMIGSWIQAAADVGVVYICPKCGEKIHPNQFSPKPQENLYEKNKEGK